MGTIPTWRAPHLFEGLHSQTMVRPGPVFGELLAQPPGKVDVQRLATRLGADWVASIERTPSSWSDPPPAAADELTVSLAEEWRSFLDGAPGDETHLRFWAEGFRYLAGAALQAAAENRKPEPSTEVSEELVRQLGMKEARLRFARVTVEGEPGLTLAFDRLDIRALTELCEVYELRPRLGMCPRCRCVFVVPSVGARSRCGRGLFNWPDRTQQEFCDGSPFDAVAVAAAVEYAEWRREYKRFAQRARQAEKDSGRSSENFADRQAEYEAWKEEHPSPKQKSPLRVLPV